MKITKTGTMAVIETDITREQYRLVSKFNPKALMLFDSETKEVLFRVTVDGTHRTLGEVGKFGALLVEGVNGKLCISVDIGGFSSEEADEFLTEEYLAPVASLQKIQEQVFAALPEIERAETAFAALFVPSEN